MPYVGSNINLGFYYLCQCALLCVKPGENYYGSVDMPYFVSNQVRIIMALLMCLTLCQTWWELLWLCWYALLCVKPSENYYGSVDMPYFGSNLVRINFWLIQLFKFEDWLSHELRVFHSILIVYWNHGEYRCILFTEIADKKLH